MKKQLLLLLMTLGLSLPCTAWAQDDGPGRGPGPRPDGREGPPPDAREGRGERGPNKPDEERKPIPLELVKEALDTIKEMHPEARWLERIEQLIENDPAEAAKHLGGFPRILELIDARRNHPDEFKLHVQLASLMREIFPMVGEYRRARHDQDQAKMDELRPKVKQKVEQIFDLRTQIEQMKVDRMKEELARAEDELDKLIDNREEEILKQLENMLDREWGRRPRGDDGERRGETPQGDRPPRDREEERPKDQ